jgi:hypothetical protein
MGEGSAAHGGGVPVHASARDGASPWVDMTADGERCALGRWGSRDDIRVITGRGRKVRGMRQLRRTPGIFYLKNLVFQGRRPFGVRSTFALPHGLVGRPCHLGTGPAARLVRCITLVAEALAAAATSSSKRPSKLRKIKHLHRKRGPTHYRGQTRRQSKGRQGPRACVGLRQCVRAVGISDAG